MRKSLVRRSVEGQQANEAQELVVKPITRSTTLSTLTALYVSYEKSPGRAREDVRHKQLSSFSLEFLPLSATALGIRK